MEKAIKVINILRNVEYVKKSNGIGWRLEYKGKTYGFWLRFEDEVEGWFDFGDICPCPVSDKELSKLIAKMMQPLLDFVLNLVESDDETAEEKSE